MKNLESIRGLAALLVVFFHIPKWNPILDIGIINNAYLMVELFFVLSGFVIYNAYINKIATRKDLLRFQFLRFGRLYPVHLIFLLFFIAIEITKYIATTKFGTQGIRATPFAEPNSPTALIQQIFLAQAIGPTGNSLTFNNPAWSISVEFYTYLIFGLSLLFFKQREIYIFSIIAFISLALLVTKITYEFDDLLRCLGGFFIGCLTAKATKNIKATLPSYLPAIFFVLIILFLQVKSPNNTDITIYFLTSALITTLMLSKNSILKSILNHKAFKWLGLISYSVYMSHFFVL